uniref:Histone H2A/H2B/H3 domain-containing protein n=1 Tax=Globodera rostochiensis TaxID=31243 RepID=A0A914H778_GLORO
MHFLFLKKGNPVHHKTSALVLKEIACLQRSQAMVIPLAPFVRLVKEMVGDMGKQYGYYRMRPKAVIALKFACEDYMVRLMEYANMLAFHAGRITLMPKGD